MNLRYDEFAGISTAPTALPNVLAPQGGVLRGMNDLDNAKAYAHEVCVWFAANDAPATVFVVRGPTSTTRLAYEVVDATAGYSVEYRVMPPAPEVAIDAAVEAARAAGLPELTQIEKLVVGERAKTRFEQEGAHYAYLLDVLTGRSGLLREASLARCRDFTARQVACLNPSLRGRGGSATALTVQFLAHPWEEVFADELDALFRDYIRGGYVVMDRPLAQMSAEGTYISAPSALEYAVTNGNTRLMVAMLDGGVTPSVAPAQDYIRALGGPVLAEAGDLLTFIERQGHTDVDGMLTAARAAIMRSAIRDALVADAPQQTTGEAPRRRARMV